MSRPKYKNRSEGRSFVAIPHACLNHENYITLSPHAVKLLLDLYANYNGKNNGDFCCTWSMMKARGWKSEETLSNARKELLHYGWILLSRQGGLNRASLYAVTFQAIDECKGKLDIGETAIAPGNWKEHKNHSWKEAGKIKSLLRVPVQCTTPPVVTQEEKPCFVG